MSKTNNETDKTEQDIVEEVVADEPVEPVEETMSAEEENSALKTEIEKLKNEYLKVFADTENLKKRIMRDQEQERKYRIQSFAMSVLPVIDNLERALKQDTSDEAFKEGVQMIYDQLMVSLKAEGVEPIDAVNKPFDPNIHQAMMTEDVDGVEANIVVEEFQKGYMLKDRILRASLVKVSQ